MTLRRWLKSTSNRTFIVWPVVLFAVEAAIQGGMPRLNLRALPLLAWGYLQYHWVGAYRTKLGGGGPGLSNPPERIVDAGIYRWMRNPMYLGHIIYMIGVALTFQSLFAAVVAIARTVWFHFRVRRDERGLTARFGEPYVAYTRRVKRWLPGLF